MTAAVVRADGASDRAERPRRMASWALAARLARREVRRRKGRTALVVALVAIPVIAMTIASVVYRTTDDTAQHSFARSYGTADLVAAEWMSGAPASWTLDEVVERLPSGSRSITVREASGQITSASGRRSPVELTDAALTDPLTEGMFDITSGRAPRTANEVLLSPNVANHLGVDVGDTLTLVVPDATYEVVGLGRKANYFGTALMVVGDFAAGTVHSWSEYVLVDLPAGVDAASFAEGAPGLGSLAQFGPTGWYDGTNSTASDVAWGWVGGTLALTVMGIIIAAAFATSARRQLVTLGQLDANGADRMLLRRTLALQGAWSGLIGSAVGICVGLVLILPQHGILERIVDHSLPGMTVAALDLVIIAMTGVVAATVAASVPSRSITRVPVLSALAGRRPLGAVPRWLVPVGIALFAGGVALIGLSAAAQSSIGTAGDRNLFAAVAVLGGLGVLFGMCCATPAIVSVFGSIGERITGTRRLAARSLARSRTRSAAIVTAIAAAGALSVGGGTAVATRWDRDDSWYSTIPYLQDNMVSVQAWESAPAEFPDNDAPAPAFVPVPDDVAAAVASIVPDAQVVPITYAGFDPIAADPTARASGEWYATQLLVVDPALADAIGLSRRDRAALADGIVLSGWFQNQIGSVGEVTARSESGAITFQAARIQDRPEMYGYVQNPLISPQRAAELGLAMGTSETLFVSPRSLTDDQRGQLQQLAQEIGAGPGSPFEPSPQGPATSYSVNAGSSAARDVPRALIDGLIVAAAMLFILAVVAVGLSLAAAESRDERDVLLAVGAPPRAMRRVSAQKAVLLTAIGGVLAIPTGFLPVVVVLTQVYDDPIRFPWLVALGCVVVVPLVVGATALAGSTIAQRVKPVRMSTLATD